MARQEKENIIFSLKSKIQKAKIIVFANFATLKVEDMTRLRKRIKSEGGELVVVKKTLFLMALKETALRWSEIVGELPGEIAFAFGYGDEIAIPKTIVQAANEMKAIKIAKAIWLGGVLTLQDVQTLAALPDRPSMRGRVMGALQSPIRNFQILFKVDIKRFLHVVEALSKK